MSMDVPAYTYVVVCMVALSAMAAFGALALALGQLAPRRHGAERDHAHDHIGVRGYVHTHWPGALLRSQAPLQLPGRTET